MNDIYKFLSVILSPPAIGFYVTIIFSLFSPIGLGSIGIFSNIVIGLIFLVLIPIGSNFYFNKKVIDILKKEDRIKPYLISIVSYLTSSAIFWLLNSHVMFLISMSYLFVASVVSVVNIFWKISAHTAGVAGPTTALVYVYGTTLLPIYVLTLLTFWVRLKMKAHSISQLIAGIIVAIFITSIVYTILW
jgi:hypothetical protein